MIINETYGGGGGGYTLVQIPTVSVGTYTYDGTAQGPTITGDTTDIVVSGATATEPGTYTLTLALKNTTRYLWSDATTADKTYSYTIDKAQITAPTVSVGTYRYTGSAQGPTITGSTSGITVSGATATEPGNYTLTLALTDSTRYEWSDGTTANKIYAYTIGRAQLNVPTVTNTSLVYTGSTQGPTITGSTANMTVSGATGTDAGTYSLQFAINDATRYEWSDGTTAAKNFPWTIDKATQAITLSADSVTLDADHLTATVSATITVDTVTGWFGLPSATSSDTSVVTVSVRETIPGADVTISSVNETDGAATVTFTVSETPNLYAATATIAVTADFQNVTVYGVSWNGGSGTAWSRTDAAASFTDPVPAVGNGNGSSPFDSCMPWSGMVRSTDSAAGVLVSIPKYYYKWTRSGATMKLQIADGPMDGFLVSPAHADRGDGTGERDVVYIGAYHCATSTYKSTSGVKPAASATRASSRTSIHSLGTKIWQYDFAMYWTIAMLYLVEYADWNSQAKIGYGCGNNSETENAGLTDAMTYHTGTNASSRTTYGHTRYRYIEDLWGNVYDWVDGIYFSGSTVYCIKNPSSFSDSSGGTNVGTRATGLNYISAWTNPTASGFEYALYPNAVSGSASTYVCDYCDYGSSGVVLFAGGCYYQNQYHGLFSLSGYGTASGSGSGIGSRLQKLP